MARKDMTGNDMASRSQRHGGSHSLADVHRGPRTGFDGSITRAVWGDDPLDYEMAIEWEAASRQRRQPGRFVEKIGRRQIPKRKRNS